MINNETHRNLRDMARDRIKITSPLRYPGGKSKLKKHFLHLFPKKNDVETFVDLFTGGGSITIEAVNLGYKNIISNDIDKTLIELHRGNVDFNLLEKKFSYNTEEKRVIFEKAKINPDDPNNFFIINKFGFSGLMKSSFSSKASVSNGSVNSVHRLKKMINHNKNVTFTSISFEKMNIPDNSFIFADPPYYGNGKKDLYRKGHKSFDHDCFIKFMKENKNMWLITYDDCEYIREQFKGYKIIAFQETYSMTNTGGNKAKIGKEIIIMNY